jgi:tripartite-type tricarboxylate transporter receptor subunit TctC
MIRSILVAVISGLLAASVQARTNISLAWPYSPAHGATPAMYALVEEANKLQDKYEFVFESKPGADGLIAIQHMNQSPSNRLSVIAAGFVDLVMQGKVVESNHTHLVGLGDMCFAVWMKNANPTVGFESIKTQGEITIGNVAWGNASHLIALIVAEKYNMKVRNIVFKSNREALLNLAQDGGVTLVVDTPNAFDDFKLQARVQAYPAAVTCGHRLLQWPNTKTLKEQGINAIAPWLIITSNKDMPTATQSEISALLNQSLINIGSNKIMEISNLHPVVFHKNKNVNDFYNERASQQKMLITKFRPTIDADRGVAAK